MVGKRGLSDRFYIESAATSTEEIGNPVHHGTVGILSRLGISCSKKRARLMSRVDYDRFDFLIGMDHYNIRNMSRICGGDPEGKISLLLSFAGEDRDVADPWYTGDFNKTYDDIKRGLEAFLKKIADN
ncbi:MAG: low molecular weight protein-tyrosine-phosphatase [Candidatus Avilachnospira sp.]